MGTIGRFEEIEAWQTARELTRQVYAVTNLGAFAHDFGLHDQLRRAAVSVMSNIAEGFENSSQQQFVRYLGYAKGSSGEVRAQLYVALDAGYLERAQFEQLFDLADKCSRQISRFISYLEAHPRAQAAREGAVRYEMEKNV